MQVFKWPQFEKYRSKGKESNNCCITYRAFEGMYLGPPPEILIWCNLGWANFDTYSSLSIHSLKRHVKRLLWAFKFGSTNKMRCYRTISNKELHVYVNFFMPFLDHKLLLFCVFIPLLSMAIVRTVSPPSRTWEGKASSQECPRKSPALRRKEPRK